MKSPILLLGCIAAGALTVHSSHAAEMPLFVSGKYVIEAQAAPQTHIYVFPAGTTVASSGSVLTSSGNQLTMTIPAAFDTEICSVTLTSGGATASMDIKILRVPEWWVDGPARVYSDGTAMIRPLDDPGSPDRARYSDSATVGEAMAIYERFVEALGIPEPLDILPKPAGDLIREWNQNTDRFREAVTVGQATHLAQGALYCLRTLKAEIGSPGFPVLLPYAKDAEGKVVYPWPAAFDSSMSRAATLGELKGLFRLDFRGSLPARPSGELSEVERRMLDAAPGDSSAALQQKLSALKEGAAAPAGQDWRTFNWTNHQTTVSTANASRFLWQAAWGPDDASIAALRNLAGTGVPAYRQWIRSQMPEVHGGTTTSAFPGWSPPGWLSPGANGLAVNYARDAGEPGAPAYYRLIWNNGVFESAGNLTGPGLLRHYHWGNNGLAVSQPSEMTIPGLSAAGIYQADFELFYAPGWTGMSDQYGVELFIEAGAGSSVMITPDPAQRGAPASKNRAHYSGDFHGLESSQSTRISWFSEAGGMWHVPSVAPRLTIRWQSKGGASPVFKLRLVTRDCREADPESVSGIPPGDMLTLTPIGCHKRVPFSKNDLERHVRRGMWLDVFPDENPAEARFRSFPWDWLTLASERAMGAEQALPLAAWWTGQDGFLPQAFLPDAGAHNDLWNHSDPGTDFVNARQHSCEAWLFYLHWRRQTRDAFPWIAEDGLPYYFGTRDHREGQLAVRNGASWRPLSGSGIAYFPEETFPGNLAPGSNTGHFTYPWQEWSARRGGSWRGYPGGDGDNFYTAWIRQALSNPDSQLRQRVAWALSQILVVSLRHPTLAEPNVSGTVFWGFANYWDILQSHAFGDYAALLKRVAVHPLMGVYLSHAGNAAEHAVLNVAGKQVSASFLDSSTYGNPGFHGTSVFPDPQSALSGGLLSLPETPLTAQNGLLLHTPSGNNFWRAPASALQVNGQAFSTVDALINAGHARRINPDENFGREIMQLFSVGVFEDEGQGPTRDLVYTNEDVRNMARVFTGLFPVTGPGNRDAIVATTYGEHPGMRWVRPMMMYEVNHDFGRKKIMGVEFEPVKPARVTPANRAMHRGLEDAALVEISSVVNFLVHGDVPAGQPSAAGDRVQGYTARNICRMLIKHLVTSNPSQAYVNHVADVFIKAGNNTDGMLRKDQLGHVVEAILLHPEARDWRSFLADREQGRIIDPLTRQLGVMRALRADKEYTEAPSADPLVGPTWFQTHGRNQGASTYVTAMDAVPFYASSVFNFFQPNHKPSGLLAGLGLTAPEFQIQGEGRINASLIGMYRDLLPGSAAADIDPTQVWRVRWTLATGFPGFSAPCSSYGHIGILGLAQSEMARATGKLFQSHVDHLLPGDPSNAADIESVIDRLDVLFCQGRMSSATRGKLKDAGTMPSIDSTSIWRVVRQLMAMPDSMVLK